MEDDIIFEKEKNNNKTELNNKNDEDNDNSEITEELKLEENIEDKTNNKEDEKDIKLENKKKKKKKKKKIEEIEEETEEDKIIKETMGFNKFASTKNKSHKDTDVSAVFLGRKAKRIYQRFMNYKPFSKILKQTYMSLNQEF